MELFYTSFFVPLAPSLITLCLTIWGWSIVSKRDRLAKAYAIHNKRIDSVQKSIDDVVQLAKKYYSHAGSDVEAVNLEPIITSKLKRLSGYISLIINELDKETDKIGLRDNFIEFKKAISGGAFNTRSRPKINLDNQVYNDITDTSDELTFALEKHLKI